MMLLAWMLRAGAALVVFIAVDYALVSAEAAWDRRRARTAAAAAEAEDELHWQAVVQALKPRCKWCTSVSLLVTDTPDTCTCDEPCDKSYCMRRQVRQERGLA